MNIMSGEDACPSMEIHLIYSHDDLLHPLVDWVCARCPSSACWYLHSNNLTGSLTLELGTLTSLGNICAGRGWQLYGLPLGWSLGLVSEWHCSTESGSCCLCDCVTDTIGCPQHVYVAIGIMKRVALSVYLRYPK